jgi:hypothetical protein
VGLGFVLATVSVYIVEIATTDMRGLLGCFVQFQVQNAPYTYEYVPGSCLYPLWSAWSRYPAHTPGSVLILYIQYIILIINGSGGGPSNGRILKNANSTYISNR